MTQKQSKIEKCVFTNEWQNPSGGWTFYHEITFENGDVGNCGTMEKYPQKLKEGSVVSYTIDDKKKIKIVSSSMETTPSYSKKPASTGGKSFGAKKQDDFLGYAWSYAKDMVVAGKTMKDVEELNNVARYIYNEIGKMLNNE